MVANQQRPSGITYTAISPRRIPPTATIRTSSYTDPVFLQVIDVALPNPRFEASYERIFGSRVAVDERSNAFFSAFYRRFLAHPGVAVLFARVDMRRQEDMLRKSLFQLATYYVLGEVTAELQRLAAVHRRLGLDPQLFDVWMQALLDTVAEFDPNCDDATRLAWGWAMAPGITYLRLNLVE